MSEENVEVVRSATEAFLAGDWDRAFASFDAEIEWEETPGLGPDAAVYRGVGEVRQAVKSWVGMWIEYDAEVHEYRDAGDDVVVLSRERGHGKASGAVVERHVGTVHTLRNGKVVRSRLFGSWGEALEAAGLSE
jgi:ketosteroid isomerase-like protein